MDLVKLTIVIYTFPELIQIMINDGLNFTLSTSKKEINPRK